MNHFQRTQLLECLQQLGSPAFQDRVWIRGQGPEVSTFQELVCQLFDDTGLGDLLASGGASAVLDERLVAELVLLNRLINQIPGGLDSITLLRHPAWGEVVSTAQRAVALLRMDPHFPGAHGV